MSPKRTAQHYLSRLNRSRHSLWLISLMSFLETIIVPIPIEVVLIPYMAANRGRIWLIATLVLAACAVASLVGYGIGYLFYQSVGSWAIEAFGWQSAYEGYRQLFDSYGFLAILTVGILPIPFQVAMIAAGLSSYPIYLFVLATLIARGLRYYGLAWLVHAFGEEAKEWWRRHAVLTSIGAAAIVAAFVFGTQFIAGRVMS